ncbi:MAG: exosortase U [Pirellula sp.]
MSVVETKTKPASISLGNLSLLDAAFGVLLLSLAPMIWIQCNSIWSRPHLQFFPMAWVGFIYFFVQRSGGLKTAESKPRLVIASGLVLTAFVASIEAVLISSPWLSYVAGVLIVVAWMYARAGNMTWQSALAISSLLWITVPLPAGYDKKMIQYLQSQSSFAASSVIDVLGIPHLREGNVLQLLDKRLFVDEACSGVDSLYALMAISLTLVLLMRQKLGVALCALSMVIVWASCGNILRLVCIVLGLKWFNLDLSDGIPHTILGLFVFLIAFGCDYAFIKFLGYLTAPVSVKNDVKKEPLESVKVLSSAKVSNGFPFGRLSKAFSVLMMVCFLGVGAYSTRVLSRGTIFRFPEFTESSLSRLKTDLVLPDKIESWRLVKREDVERAKDNVMGQFSEVWLYDAGSKLGTVSVDFPFRGFHLLDICYEGAGWKQVENRDSIDSSLGESSITSAEPAQVHFLDLSKDTGEFAYVAFTQFQLDGTPVRSKAAGRGLERFEQTFLEPVTYQIQAIITSKTPISNEQKKEVEMNLLTAAALIRPHFVRLEAKE